MADRGIGATIDYGAQTKTEEEIQIQIQIEIETPFHEIECGIER